ncbi:MAG TPA: hypothetical protein VFM88_02190 [Vicinamibacteria bacterium]|nr:hypothetical protein [Vicinamibacteria bacterium]
MRDDARAYCILHGAWTIATICPWCLSKPDSSVSVLLTPHDFSRIDDVCAKHGLFETRKVALQKIADYRDQLRAVEHYPILKQCPFHPDEFHADPDAPGCPIFQVILEIAESAPALSAEAR